MKGENKITTTFSRNSGIALLVLIIAISGLSTLNIVSGFIHAIAIALILVVIFRPVHFFIKRKVKSGGIASLISFFLILLVIVVPIGIFILIIAAQSKEIAEMVNNWFQTTDFTFNSFIDSINAFFNSVGLPQDVSIDQAREFLQGAWQSIGLKALQVITGLVSGFFSNMTSYIIFLFTLATMLEGLEKVQDYISNLSPFNKEINLLFGERVKEMSVSMVKGTFLIAFAKGIASAVILILTGVPFVPVWTLIATFACIIPVGSGIVMFPLGALVAIGGNPLAGIIIIVYTILVTENLELIMRPRLVGESARLPDIIILIAVLGGISVFGFMGIVYGPLVIIIFLTSLEVFRKFNSGEINLEK